MNTPTHLSTSTPASEVSSSDFAKNDGLSGSEEAVPSMADILRNSPAAKVLGIDTESQPKDTEEDMTQDEESEGDSPTSDEESENETDQDQETDEGEPAEDEEDSTPEGELPAEDDIEWSYKIPVKIDGEVKYLTLEEVRKGYATDQHLSQKGRELGELKKQVELERSEKLAELVKMGTMLHGQLSGEEQKFQAEYHKMSQAIEKARDEGDTYGARELKEQREAVQEKYWKARGTRETREKEMVEVWQKQQSEQQQVLLNEFKTQVKDKIPDFSEKVANSIRDFALKEGIPEELLNQLYDVNAIKFINDYRKLKTARDTGEMKRKEAPKAKQVPSKKGTPTSQRERDAAQNNRSKVLSGQGNKGDELDFLKRISSVSKKL